jgi:hypothetical protein
MRGGASSLYVAPGSPPDLGPTTHKRADPLGIGRSTRRECSALATQCQLFSVGGAKPMRGRARDLACW